MRRIVCALSLVCVSISTGCASSGESVVRDVAEEGSVPPDTDQDVTGDGRGELEPGTDDVEGDEADGDGTIELPDSIGDAWEASCGPSDNPGMHQPEYDGACVGNAGCSTRACQACTSSCTLCDGPRCVSVVHDDSCLTAPGQVSEWAEEPVGGVAAAASGATMSVGHPAAQTIVLNLAATETVPSSAAWLDDGGVQQVRALVAPVTRVADRVLVAGAWSMTNWCTGQVASGSASPQLLDVVVESGERASATLPFTDGEPWEGRVAWIRAFEDSAGSLVFQWFEPSRAIVFGYNATGSVDAIATEPIPADKARPLGSAGASFDWASAMKDAIEASSNRQAP